MTFNKNIIEIIKPSKKLFSLFDKIKEELLEIIPSSNISLIGSMAVPMKGKKEIDILLETKDVEEAQNLLIDKGFSKGPIIVGEGFSINRNYKVLVELHIVPFGHKKIEIYKQLIDKLKNNKELRKRYEDFKVSCSGFSEKKYKQEKNKFLEKNNLT